MYKIGTKLKIVNNSFERSVTILAKIRDISNNIGVVKELDVNNSPTNENNLYYIYFSEIDEHGWYYEKDLDYLTDHDRDKIYKKILDNSTDYFNELSNLCHSASYHAGWWHDPKTNESLLHNESYTPYVIASKLMLIVSEISEAMEGHRKGLNDDKLTDRPMLEVELADAIIRIMDLIGALKLDIGGAINEKLKFNLNRPDHKVENRRKIGGKLY